MSIQYLNVTFDAVERLIVRAAICCRVEIDRT